MSELQPHYVMLFGGGFASDSGPNVDLLEVNGYHITLPFLANAEDMVFSMDGGVRKAPGASKLNTVAAIAATTITGLYDCWFSGTAGTPTQKRIITLGTKIMKEDADGTFDDLFTGLVAAGQSSFAMLEDLLVICNTSYVPKSWDNTTAQNLAGTPPNASIVVEHKNRLWMAGAAAAPSLLYYSALLSPADWAGAGSGAIAISPDDGSVITGLASHNNELIVFKGKGGRPSIHRITGDSPDDFSRITHRIGIGCCAHNTIFPFQSDLGFMDTNGQIQSFNTVTDYGAYSEVALSRDIQTWLREHLSYGQLAKAHAAVNPDEGKVLFGIAVDGGSAPNYTLCMDYRFNPVRWSKWPSFAGGSLATVLDSGRTVIMAGGNDGFVRKYFQSTRTIDASTGIAFKVESPTLTLISPKITKTLVDLSLQISPKNNGNINLRWTRDSSPRQTTTINQQGSSAVLGSFILGTDTLGASTTFATKFAQFYDGGEFRDIRFQVDNNEAGEDVEVHGIGLTFEQGAESTENF